MLSDYPEVNPEVVGNTMPPPSAAQVWDAYTVWRNESKKGPIQDRPPNPEKKLLKWQRRKFFCTLNNPTEQEWHDLAELKGLQHIVGQFEIGSKKQGPHIQFVVTLPTRRQFPANIHSAVNYAPLRQEDRALLYCTNKDKDHVAGTQFEYGVPCEPGHRTDFDELAQALKNGAGAEQVAQDFPIQAIRYSRGLQFLADAVLSDIRQKPQATWCVGMPARHTAMKNYQEDKIYFRPRTGKWWPRYRAEHHDAVVLKWPSGNMTKQDLLDILGEDPYYLELKGRSVPLRAQHIYIESAEYPDDDLEDLFTVVLSPRIQAQAQRIQDGLLAHARMFQD